MNMAHLPPEPRPSVPIPDPAARGPDRARTETWRDRTDSRSTLEARSRWNFCWVKGGKEPRQRGPSMRLPQISAPSESMALASLPFKALMPKSPRRLSTPAQRPKLLHSGVRVRSEAGIRNGVRIYISLCRHARARKIHPGRFVSFFARVGRHVLSHARLQLAKLAPEHLIWDNITRTGSFPMPDRHRPMRSSPFSPVAVTVYFTRGARPKPEKHATRLPEPSLPAHALPEASCVSLLLSASVVPFAAVELDDPALLAAAICHAGIDALDCMPLLKGDGDGAGRLALER